MCLINCSPNIKQINKQETIRRTKRLIVSIKYKQKLSNGEMSSIQLHAGSDLTFHNRAYLSATFEMK